jgi:putative glutamine amidotransferase
MTQKNLNAHYGNHFQTIPYDQPSHHINLDPEGRLARILKTNSTQVNSMHHQGVFELAPELRALAYDDEGLVEAIEHPSKPFTLGVQWHPEFLGTRNSMNLLFERFVDACQIESGCKKVKRSNIAIDLIHAGFVWPQVSFIDRQPKITG